MKLSINIEQWPVRGVFRISRRETTETEVLTVTLQDGDHIGRGECGPIVRYGETVESCRDQIKEIRSQIEAGISHEALGRLLPHGSARNALDCAKWDLSAKRAGKRIWTLAGLPAPKPLTTAFTLSVDAPEKVLEAAEAAAHLPLLKLKLAGDEDDLTRVRAVRAAAPRARLIVDANEAFTANSLATLLPVLAGLQVEMVEQPLPAGKDDALKDIESPVPLCADESCHMNEDLAELATKYQAINIKLDKTGGLSAALVLADQARQNGLDIMVGCMLGTSLAMAPAILVAQGARWIDLDGPLLLDRDRDPGLHYDHGIVSPPRPEVWG